MKNYNYKSGILYRLPSFVVLLLLLIMPSDGLGFSTCIFQHLFGFSCPACGLTRSMSSLLKLEFISSFSYHPLGFIILVFICLCLITNDPNFLRSKNKIFETLFSLKSLSFLFLMVWILRIM